MTGPGSKAITAGSQTFMNPGEMTRRPRNIAFKARRTSDRGVRMNPIFTPMRIVFSLIRYRGVATAAGHTVVTPTP